MRNIEISDGKETINKESPQSREKIEENTIKTSNLSSIKNEIHESKTIFKKLGKSKYDF